MKKLLFLILMCCLGETCIMKAANTDISSIPNVIYIEPFQVQPGVTNYELSIRMKNSVDIRGFQFDIVLPDGIIPVVEDDVILCDLNGDRAPQNSKGKFYHDINATEQDDGSYRVLCGSQQEKTFLGTDGEVAVLYVNIASDMAAGDYPFLLKNIKLTETDISKFYSTEMLETTVSVSGSSDTRTILDETSTVAPASATSANVLVKRTINANEWSTICLPFTMTEEQVKTAFGSAVELADFTGYDTTEDAGEAIVGITVNFETVTSIDANHPYIIKVKEAVSEFTVDGVDIVPEDVPCVALGTTTGKGKNAVYHPMDFTGTYVADFDFFHDAQSRALFLNGNKFYYATENTKHMKAFRAYFDFDDVLSEVGGAGSRISMSFDRTITGISEIVNSESSNSKYYDLQGRRVAKPGKGLFVKDGKKVIIK